LGKYIIKRLLLAIPTLFGVIIGAFLIMHLIPGDPVEVMLFGTSPTPEQVAEMRATLGLDQPLFRQFTTYMWGVIRGDLGESIQRHAPVAAEIAQRMVPTLQLTFAGMGIAIVFGFALGIVAALRPNSWIDNVAMGAANLTVAIPAFWLGILLILLFALNLGWFPATGQGGGKRLVLPALSLGIGYSAIIARLVRANLIQVLEKEYILTARSKGLIERVVVLRHALKNALIPVITMIGLQFGNMMGSAVVIETLFARMGLGRLLVLSILQRDYPLIQGTILVFGIIYIISNLIIDVLYSLVDPRIHYA
jgi:peptide/nickel transport system permease protein/oligopeptide transport system permease protein